MDSSVSSFVVVDFALTCLQGLRTLKECERRGEIDRAAYRYISCNIEGAVNEVTRALIPSRRHLVSLHRSESKLPITETIGDIKNLIPPSLLTRVENLGFQKDEEALLVRLLALCEFNFSRDADQILEQLEKQKRRT